ncbi:MAG TPA: response regulator [Burkholderiaceae bacterium]
MSASGGGPAAREEVRVVIVEDDDDTCQTLKMLIELDGYSVRTAASAEQAAAVILEHDPACVILDLHLPGASGIELTRRLRASLGHALVVIAVTGSVDPSEQLAAEAAGVDFLLHKPLDVARFRKIVPPLH